MDIKDIFITICDFIDIRSLITLLQVCKKYRDWIINLPRWKDAKIISNHERFYKATFPQNQTNFANEYEKFADRSKLEFKTTISLGELIFPHTPEYRIIIEQYIEEQIINEISELMIATNGTYFDNNITIGSINNTYLKNAFKQKNPKFDVNEIWYIVNIISQYNSHDRDDNKIYNTRSMERKKIFDFFDTNLKKFCIKHVVERLKQNAMSKKKVRTRNECDVNDFLNDVCLHIFSKELTIIVGSGKLIFFMNSVKITCIDKIKTESVNYKTKELNAFIKSFAARNQVDHQFLSYFIRNMIKRYYSIHKPLA
jgi:hypothetical protein